MNGDSLRKRLMAAAAAGLALAVLMMCVFGTVKMQGHNMEPAISEGERVIVNKLAYFYREPAAGDVVTLNCDVYSEDGEGSLLIRRIVAVEGDTVEIRDGKLYINGKHRQEHINESVYLETMETVTVGKDRVFVLSDSGTAVLDSRDSAVGQLRTYELMGRVCFE